MDAPSTLAARLYQTARADMTRSAGDPAGDAVGMSFGDALQAAAVETLTTVRAGETTALKSMAGQADAQAVVEALAGAELALQTAVAVRDRVVEAYQEILRMPV